MSGRVPFYPHKPNAYFMSHILIISDQEHSLGGYRMSLNYSIITSEVLLGEVHITAAFSQTLKKKRRSY